MKDINELKVRKTDMVAEARKYLDECTKEDRKMTDEEKETYEGKLADIREMNETIKREEELQAEEMRTASQKADEFRTVPAIRVGDGPEDRILDDPQGGFQRMGHYFRDLILADPKSGGQPSEALVRWQAAVRTAGYMEEGSGAQGGYTVPVEYSKKLIEKSLESAIVRPRIPAENIMELQGNRIEIPADVDDDHSTDYFGGIVLYRPGESGQITPKNPVFDMIALTIHDLKGLCYVSNDLLEDSIISMENYLTRKFGQAIGFVEDNDYLMGTGANMPLGIFHSNNPSIITQDAESGQGASTVIYDNIVKMWSRLYPAGQDRAIWVINNDVFPQLALMNLAVGTGGAPVWIPAGGASGSPYNTLMGRPVLTSEKMQTLGTAGDIGLVDLSQYYLAKKMGSPKFDSSMHIRFDYDETGFRFVLRYDGQPTWKSTLTPKNSSNTLGPAVVLNSTRT